MASTSAAIRTAFYGISRMTIKRKCNFKQTVDEAALGVDENAWPDVDEKVVLEQMLTLFLETGPNREIAKVVT